MEKFKGTKGKWSQSHRIIPGSKKGMYSTQVYDELGETIATLAWYPADPIKENGVTKIGTYREANAQLISCAPEILKMLISIRDYDELNINDYFNVDELIKKATCTD